MGNLSQHFTTSEFACKDGCGFGTNPEDVDPLLLDILENVRAYFDKPVHVNCGCRCPKHNTEVGGEPHSYHMKGMAADIVVSGVPAHEVATYLETVYPDTHGIGRYKSFTHIDSRKPKARWKR